MVERKYVGVVVSSILGTQRCWVRTRWDDVTVLAACMRLTREGKAEEAEVLLDRYCSGSLR